MPINSPGTHTPVHDWTQDRDDGIKIEASRMDDQHADFSSALTDIVTGAQPFKGKLQGVNGTVSVPAFSFESDPDTGWYLSATGELSAATGGGSSTLEKPDQPQQPGIGIQMACAYTFVSFRQVTTSGRVCANDWSGRSNVC